MKAVYVQALLLSGCLAPSVAAMSLYDLAPPIGVPESHLAQYSVSFSAGYDDNVNSASRHSDQDDGGFISFGVSGSYSDQESAQRISYSANIGGQLYDKDAQGTDKRMFSNCSLSASLSRALGALSNYSTSLSLSYQPEPDYANGISSARTQGDCFTWGWSHSFSRAIDSRWSWSLNGSYSGSRYTEQLYQIDNRWYLGGGASLSYRQTALTSYSLNASYSYAAREEGYNSDNVYLTLGISHSLSPVSSCSASFGTQYKVTGGENSFYPTINLGYNRSLTSGLSAQVYVAYSNENVNTYRYNGQGGHVNYLSDGSFRYGTSLSYALSHKVTFTGSISLINSHYSKSTAGAANRDELTWETSLGMSYRFTEKLSGNVTWSHTEASRDAGDYSRNVISSGVSYSF